MYGNAVLRVLLVELEADAVTRYLCEYGCRRYRRRERIAVNHRHGGHRKAPRVVAVYENSVRLNGESLDCAIHCEH